MSGPWWDKEWNKRGTRETEAFPIRDGNHVPLQLCNPLYEFLHKKPREKAADSANNGCWTQGTECEPVVVPAK